MSKENLWGELSDADDSSPPAQLLQEQAAYLERETSGELVGEVEQLPNRLHYVVYDMNIVVPSLQNYRYTVLQVEYHPAMHYPVKIADLVHASEKEAANEEEYRQIIREILTSADTRRVIATLRRQARQQPA